jgi:hypothetical protein
VFISEQGLGLKTQCAVAVVLDLFDRDFGFHWDVVREVLILPAVKLYETRLPGVADIFTNLQPAVSDRLSISSSVGSFSGGDSRALCSASSSA